MAIIYQIHVRGHLGAQWSQWFDGLQITTMANGESHLSGTLPDQAALFGVLARIRDLGLTLLSVERVSDGETSPATSNEAITPTSFRKELHMDKTY